MSDGPGLFREEALRHADAGGDAADVLRLAPSWTRWAYWLLLGALGAGLLYSILGTLHSYAAGPAVIWRSGRLEITARADGTVRAVEVSPGQRVEAGALLARFHDDRERAELNRLQRELDLTLARALRDPADQAAREALTSLRAARDLAAARAAQLEVRAPRAGVVGDVRIRPGQRLAAGDLVLTVLDDGGELSIRAMLPAHARPELRPGMALRFEVQGYRHAWQEMRVTQVGAQIIGLHEVQRWLGQEIADTVGVEGPVVLIEARPRSPTFEVDGQTFHFHHGMSGRAEVRLRSERLAVALVPALRGLDDQLGQ